MQNWVKRDIKEMIGSPQKGKKYSIEQAALLFIVEDLKTALDFESIRKLLRLIVNDPADRSDDLINPVHLYGAYSSLFEELNQGNCLQLNATDTVHTIENIVKEKLIKSQASSIKLITSNAKQFVTPLLSPHFLYIPHMYKC